MLEAQASMRSFSVTEYYDSTWQMSARMLCAMVFKAFKQVLCAFA